MRENFPNLIGYSEGEDRSKGKRADRLLSDIMNDELRRGEKALKEARSEEQSSRRRKA